MKLQISFDTVNLDKALKVALDVSDFADIIEIGSPLIYTQGLKVIEIFKEKFPAKEIFADTKLVDRVEPIIKMFAKSGTDYISILAGTDSKVIQSATKIARDVKCKVALDLVDAYSMAQSSFDAKALDIDRIIFHGPREVKTIEDLLEEWESVRGNTNIPIFMGGDINKNNIEKILSLKPNGIIVGAAITKSDNPSKEAEYFKLLLA